MQATGAPVLPDYRGGGIVNLMSSLGQALGAPAGPYPALAALPPSALGQRRNTVLLVLDGLGAQFLAEEGTGGALHAHRRATLTSVFPPTTATAITAFLTGVAPQQHGLVGWFTYLKEVGGVVAVLPFRARCGAALRPGGVEPGQVFTTPPLFDALPVASFVISPRDIVNSEYNTRHSGRALRLPYQGLPELFAGIRRVVASGTGRQYVYAYYPELDAMAHVFGIGSPQVRALFSRLDALFADFLASIAGTDTTLVVTADHGFVDVKPENTIELERHPALAATLVLPLCGERRAAFCYVHPERTAAFESYVGDVLGEQADLWPSGELLAGGWFGLGPAHPRLTERIGHYALIMREGWAIKDWVLGEKHHVHIGHHGGVSAAEMQVPLMLAHA